MTFRLFLVPIALVPVIGIAASTPHSVDAFAVPSCHDDSSIARSNTHGSPLNGSFGHAGAAANHSNSYYYLDVKTASGCGAGADGLVHYVGRVQANGIGLLPGCTLSTNWGPPCTAAFRRETGLAVHNDDPTWSFEFKNAATGAIIACTGGNGSGGTDCPGTPNITAVPGDAVVEFRYNGPVTAVRFRIANEYDDPIWEASSLDIVPCSTCEPSRPLPGS